MNQYDYLFKFILIGDTGVGKSCMLMRFIDDRFRSDHDATIGVEFGSKIINVDNQVLKIQIWDTAGQESFRSITRSYYKGAICALAMYDVTKRSSFENLARWLADIKEQGNADTITMIVGNKKELEDYFEEVSAKTGDNINVIFTRAATEIIHKITENPSKYSSESIGIKVGLRRHQIDNPIIESEGKTSLKNDHRDDKKRLLGKKDESTVNESAYCQC